MSRIFGRATRYMAWLIFRGTGGRRVRGSACGEPRVKATQYPPRAGGGTAAFGADRLAGALIGPAPRQRVSARYDARHLVLDVSHDAQEDLRLRQIAHLSADGLSLRQIAAKVALLGSERRRGRLRSVPKGRDCLLDGGQRSKVPQGNEAAIGGCQSSRCPSVPSPTAVPKSDGFGTPKGSLQTGLFGAAVLWLLRGSC